MVHSISFVCGCGLSVCLSARSVRSEYIVSEFLPPRWYGIPKIASYYVPPICHHGYIYIYTDGCPEEDEGSIHKVHVSEGL